MAALRLTGVFDVPAPTMCLNPNKSASTRGLDYLGYQVAPARWHAGTVTSKTTVKTLLILGASGDLTGRLLLPGLAGLLATGRVAGLRLVGAGSDPWTAQQWKERVDTSFAAAAGAAESAGRSVLDSVAASTEYHQVDVTADGRLADLLARLEGPVAIYFAPPRRSARKPVPSCAVTSFRPEPGWYWRSLSARGWNRPGN